MKKTSLLILIAILIPLLMKSQYRIILKMNPLECISCYSGNIAIENFDSEIPIEFIFESYSKSTVDRFLERSFLSETVEMKQIKVTISDSIFNEFATTSFSEMYIFENNDLKDRLDFKDFWDFEGNLKYLYSKQYNQNAKVHQNEINGCSDIALDNDLDFIFPKISFGTNRIAILDEVLNICYVFDRNGKILQKLDGLKIVPSEIIPFNTKIANDTSLLKKIEQLKKIGYFSVTLESVELEGESCYVSMSVPYIVQKPNSDRLIVNKAVAVAFLDSNNKLEIILTEHDFPENKTYSFKGFSIKDSSISLPRFNYDENSENFTYSICQTQKTHEGIKLISNYLLQVNQTNFTSKTQLNLSIKNEIAHIQHSPFFIDYIQNTTIKIDELTNRTTQSFLDKNIDVNILVQDWEISNDDSLIYIVYYDKVKSTFNLLSNSISSSIQNDISMEAKLPINIENYLTCKFVDTEKLYVLLKNQTIKCFNPKEILFSEDED